MSNSISLYRLVLPLLIALMLTPAAGKSQSTLKNIAEQQYALLMQGASILNLKMGRIIYSDAGSSHATGADNNIIINLAKIDKFTQDSSDLFKTMFIKYVIAHELAHKFQYGTYNQEIISGSRGEQLIYLECNADIIAAMFVAQVYSIYEVPAMFRQNPNFNAAIYTDRLSRIVFSVYNRIFQMDNANVLENRYPTTAERLLALRQGTILGSSALFYYAQHGDHPVGLALTRRQLDSATRQWNRFDKAIDFDPASINPFSWANTEAIKIIHENNLQAKNVIIYDQRIEPINASQSGKVSFSFKVINKNPSRIRFAGRVYTEIVPRNDPNYFLHIAPSDALVFERILGPGETSEISGQLDWFSDGYFTPRVVMPGENGSLYSVFLYPNETANTTTQEPSFNYDFSTWTDYTPDELHDFLKIINTKRDIFDQCIRGIGISSASSPAELMRGDIEYQPIFKSGAQEDQKMLWLGAQSLYAYDFNAFASRSFTDCDRHYPIVLDKLATAFPDARTRDKLIDNRFRSRTFSDQQGNDIATVVERYNYVSQKNVITVRIFGKRRGSAYYGEH